MSALSSLLEGQPLQAVSTLLDADLSLNVDENPDLNDLVTSRDLAEYIVVASLAQMPRLEIKKSLLSSSHVLSLLELFEHTSEIFDNFLNGRYQKLFSSL